jgi:hypothetical protein
MTLRIIASSNKWKRDFLLLKRAVDYTQEKIQMCNCMFSLPNLLSDSLYLFCFACSFSDVILSSNFTQQSVIRFSQ